MSRYVAFAFLFLPFIASAQVSFSEIMYDLEGSDADREWVELRNDGDTAVDLSTWRLFEAQTNHKLTLFAGEQSVPPGGYAVIADDANKFLSDWPDFSGTLFDSSFSLGNAGEALILRDSALQDVDAVSYLPEWGAAGDGNSLQKSGDGAWSAHSPSPGSATISPVEAGASPVVSETALVPSYATEPQQKIIADAGPARRTAVVGGGTVFKGIVYGLHGEPVPNARLSWSFGDGSTGEGLSVSHTYRYPGEYVIMLEGSFAGYSASDRVDIIVVPPDIFIDETGTESDFFISVTNGTKLEIDLSGWSFVSGSGQFFIPPQTVILPGKRLAFPPSITLLSANDVSLLCPDGTVASAYKKIVTTHEKLDDSQKKPHESVLSRARESVGGVSEKKDNNSTAEALQYIASPAGIGVTPEDDTRDGVPSSIAPWLFALIILVAVSSAGVFFLRGKKTAADQFKIIEEKKPDER